MQQTVKDCSQATGQISKTPQAVATLVREFFVANDCAREKMSEASVQLKLYCFSMSTDTHIRLLKIQSMSEQAANSVLRWVSSLILRYICVRLQMRVCEVDVFQVHIIRRASNSKQKT